MENNEKTLFESLTGLVQIRREQTGQNTITPGTPPVPGDPRQRDENRILHQKLHGVDLFDFNFRGWQKEIIDELRKRNNIYVVSSPGSGKTAPIMFYWAEQLGVNPGLFKSRLADQRSQINSLQNSLLTILTDPGSLPKILYLCPVRQLVYEIQKDFRSSFSKFILHLINLTLFENRLETVNVTTTRNLIITALNRICRFNFTALFTQRVQMFNQMRLNQTTNPSIANRFAKNIEIINEQISDKLSEGIKRYIDSTLVGIKTDVNPLSNKNAPVTISIYESGYGVFKDLFKNNFRLLIIDEAHLLQDLPINNTDRIDNIVESIYDIFKDFSKNQSGKQIVFLSGTVNPNSAKDLTDYLELCLNIRIKRLISSSVAKNPSDVSVLPMDNLINNNTLVNLLINPKENNNAIILFSKKRIDSIIDEALRKTEGNKYTTSQIDKGVLQTATSSQYGINLSDLERNLPQNTSVHRSNRFENTTSNIVEKINKMPGAENIKNEKLLRCVLSGFGFIYNMDFMANTRQEKRHAGMDQQIVANLFSQGKIKTIIATDAIGIGVNLKIKNMYIPDINKFIPGKGETRMPISDASQLYNRTGRIEFNVSNIYTPSQFVDDIIIAISAGNDKFDKRETIIKNRILLCKSKQFFRSLFTSYQNQLARNDRSGGILNLP